MSGSPLKRPIGKFQAVQHNSRGLAGENGSCARRVGLGPPVQLGQSGNIDESGFFEGASAKIRCVEAATEGAAIAHQVLRCDRIHQGTYPASLHTAHTSLARRLW